MSVSGLAAYRNLTVRTDFSAACSWTFDTGSPGGIAKMAPDIQVLMLLAGILLEGILTKIPELSLVPWFEVRSRADSSRTARF